MDGEEKQSMNGEEEDNDLLADAYLMAADDNLLSNPVWRWPSSDS